MIALIDGDLVAFRCAASAENENLPIALLRVEKLMQDIIQAVNADNYMCFLTGKENFRKQINPEYKAHRKDIPAPKWLQDCREYLVVEWKSKVSDGIEADDELGIQQTKETVICSLDKDLLQVPGFHYQWPIYNREGMFHTITELEGLKHFYKQMLIGDVSDNVRGVDKIGKVKAAKIIDVLDNEYDMYQAVCQLYKDHERFDMNANCLWIMREEGIKFTDRDPWGEHVD